MKLIFLCGLFILSSSSFANSGRPFMTIKERLRLQLWVEGIESEKIQKNHSARRPLLKEELEIPLLKM